LAGLPSRYLSRPTQPGHPSAGRCNEYRSRFGPSLGRNGASESYALVALYKSVYKICIIYIYICYYRRVDWWCHGKGVGLAIPDRVAQFPAASDSSATLITSFISLCHKTMQFGTCISWEVNRHTMPTQWPWSCGFGWCPAGATESETSAVPWAKWLAKDFTFLTYNIILGAPWIKNVPKPSVC